MPEYVIYDKNGKIIEKYYSVDPKVVEGKTNCLKVTRDVFNGLTRWSYVKDGKIVEMTQVEKDVVLAAEQAIKDAETAKKQAVIDDLKKVGLSEETISFLMSGRV